LARDLTSLIQYTSDKNIIMMEVFCLDDSLDGEKIK